MLNEEENKMKINRFEEAEEFQSTYDHCAKIRKIIDGLIRYLKNHQSG
jgi:hypothetical protein